MPKQPKISDHPARRAGGRPEPKAPAPTGKPRSGRILVMDEEEAVRKVLGLTLQRMGHEVKLAGDGQTAVEIYERAKSLGCPFDLVFLDLMVTGGMGGQAAIQALLRIDPAVKSVVMSGYANAPVLLKYKRYGFTGALAKPFDQKELEEILSRAMSTSPGSKGAP